ncbi:hypothetical protein L6164_023422 [Bauhinia variegata]|uniref:Uncharacterized protein n=1 Tax=Bauhinia variegata TaxID=167791 RepID=A0ACB9MI64_BAUVA|nr:hypothetical protein L6164_023422 [Bauhinia variegata]
MPLAFFMARLPLTTSTKLRAHHIVLKFPVSSTPKLVLGLGVASVDDLKNLGISMTPLVIDWALGSETCESAPNSKEYACSSHNTECEDDIDECIESKPCIRECHNVPGNYCCSCPEDMKEMEHLREQAVTKNLDYEIVALIEECSAILHKKLPPKLEDLGSFTIPCNIGQEHFHKVLCDLGASINLMPLSIFNKLNLGEAKPTTISLLLVDRSIKYPRGIVEDMLVKVNKFIFPADFIVLDMEENQEIPIIWGRPFLATRRALIDVQKGNLTLRVQDEEVTFNILKVIKHPADEECCYRLDSLD